MYFVIFELKLGATVGKLIFCIRVRSTDGAPIKLGQSFTRNLLRFVDAFPYIIPYLVGLVSVASNDYKQRIGDKAAHTIVVKA